VQDVAEVRSRLRLGRLRPERERQVLALLRCVSMQEQICQKRLGAGGVERLQPLLAEAQIDPAQETDAQRGLLGARVIVVTRSRPFPSHRARNSKAAPIGRRSSSGSAGTGRRLGPG
jgi:hypothetical protein